MKVSHQALAKTLFAVAAIGSASIVSLSASTVPVFSQALRFSQTVNLNTLSNLMRTGSINVATTVAQLPTPIFSSFSPASGAPGTGVFINGSNLKNNNIRVFFNGVEAKTRLLTPTALLAVVPQGATTGQITLTIPDGTVISSPGEFTVLPPRR
jgi:hypothetical protein